MTYFRFSLCGEIQNTSGDPSLLVSIFDGLAFLIHLVVQPICIQWILWFMEMMGDGGIIAPVRAD